MQNDFPPSDRYYRLGNVTYIWNIWRCESVVPWNSKIFKMKSDIERCGFHDLSQIGMRKSHWGRYILSGRRGSRLGIFELWDLLEIKEMRILKCRTYHFKIRIMSNELAYLRVIISLSMKKIKIRESSWNFTKSHGRFKRFGIQNDRGVSRRFANLYFFHGTKIL